MDQKDEDFHAINPKYQLIYLKFCLYRLFNSREPSNNFSNTKINSFSQILINKYKISSQIFHIHNKLVYLLINIWILNKLTKIKHTIGRKFFTFRITAILFTKTRIQSSNRGFSLLSTSIIQSNFGRFLNKLFSQIDKNYFTQLILRLRKKRIISMLHIFLEQIMSFCIIPKDFMLLLLLSILKKLYNMIHS